MPHKFRPLPMTSAVIGLLGAYAKKLMAKQAKRFGKAVYERTLKPLLEGLRDKATDYVRKLATPATGS